MNLDRNFAAGNCKREALRYQPFFDLRKNIAKVVAHYTMTAVQKGISLDIFVAHETPNYFHGNVSCFLLLLSQLLKHAIDSLDQGEISIRIYHDSLHQTNDCDAELSIIITTHNPRYSMDFPHAGQPLELVNSTGRRTNSKSHAALIRIKDLCGYFAGNLTWQNLTPQKTQYFLTCILQQTHPAGTPQFM